MTTDTQHIPSGYKPSPLGIIPEDWEVKRLGNFAPLQRGFDLPTDRIIKGDFPVVYSNGILNYHHEYKAKGPGVVTGRSGTIGKVTFVESDYWPHNTSLWVTDFNGNNPKYVFYLYSYLDLSKFSSGSGVPTLNRNDVHVSKIAVPPIDEQNRIVKVLELWDTAIAKQMQLIEKLTLRKRGLMQQLLTGKKRLKGFEGEWKEVRLGEVCDLTKGEQVNSETLTNTGLFPVINGGITPSGYKDDYNTEANTITISEGGNSCGFVNLIKTKFWSGGHCYTISNIVNFDLNYLYYSLKFAEPHIMNLRVGSGLPNIQLGPLQKFILLMPQLEEQKAISAFLEQADKGIEIQKQKLASLQEQKKGLMQVLLTGKRRVI